MHRTNGDSYGTDTSSHAVPGIHVYRDEDPGIYDATQGRHQEMNALQEEICDVIEHESITLNSDTETPATMTQLRAALDARHVASRVTNDSTVTGSYVDDALNTLKGVMEDNTSRLDNLGTDDVANESTLNGTTLTDVLNDLDDTEVKNNSLLEGTTVKDNMDLIYWQRVAHIMGCDYVNDLTYKNIFIFNQGWAVDSTNNYLMRMPTYGGGYRKLIENSTGWVAGHNGNGLPASITCIAGTRLYIFLIRRAGGLIDIGFDTSITAANLIADGTCAALQYRRIGYCQVESIDTNDCDCWVCICKEGHHYVGQGNGFAKGIQYDITMTAAFEYLYGDNQYLPDFDCIAWFVALPPSGGACLCTVLTRYMSGALTELQTAQYYNAILNTAPVTVYGTSGIEQMPAFTNTDNGFIIGVDTFSGITAHMRVMGFYDFRDRDIIA
jgi:hypothetical protein